MGKFRKVVALILLLFAFRAEIYDYGQKVISYIGSVEDTLNIEKPEQSYIDDVISKGILKEDADYTEHDRLVMAVYFNNFAKELMTVSERGEQVQAILDWQVKSLQSYIVANKLDKNYTYVVTAIKDIFKSSFDEFYGVSTKEEVEDYSKKCKAIAWCFVNGKQ